MSTVPVHSSPVPGNDPVLLPCPCAPCVARVRRRRALRAAARYAAGTLAAFALAGAIITLALGMPVYSGPCAGIAAVAIAAAVALRRP